jgi:hypothetical protein
LSKKLFEKNDIFNARELEAARHRWLKSQDQLCNLIYPEVAARSKNVKASQAAAFEHSHKIVKVLQPGTRVRLNNPTLKSKWDANYDGNFYVDAFLSSNQSLRAPIFYDSNNTGYYVDPTGTSNLSDLYANQFFVNGNYNGIRFNSAASSDLVISCIPGTRVFEIRNGNGPSPNYGACALITGTGLFTADVTAYYSDERLKDKQGPIINALEKIKSLNGFYYVNNELAKENGYTDEKIQLGLSAQEVKAIAPEIVTLAPFDTNFNEYGTKTSKSGENYLTVDYGKLVPILVEAIKEQQTQIEELKKSIN